jgi:hypothetical protein
VLKTIRARRRRLPRLHAQADSRQAGFETVSGRLISLPFWNSSRATCTIPREASLDLVDP